MNGYTVKHMSKHTLRLVFMMILDWQHGEVAWW